MAGGRPTKMTPATVQKLEQAFLMGCTDIEACLYADISRATLHNYTTANPEFLDRKEILKQNPVMLARGVIIDALIDKDINTANKVIDRKEGSKVTLNGGENPIGVELSWNVQPVKAQASDR